MSRLAPPPADPLDGADPFVDPARGTLNATRWLMWLLVVPVLALLAVLTLLQYQQRLAEAERDLLRSADARAQELEAIARPAMAHVQDLKRLLEERWNDAPDGGPALRDALQPVSAPGRPAAWTLDGAPPPARQRFGQLLWAAPDGAPPDAPWLRRAQAFADAARMAQARAPSFDATWFIAADANTSFGVPYVPAQRLLAALHAPDLHALAPQRAARTQRIQRALAADPGDTSFWGLPHASHLDGLLALSHGAWVVVDGAYRGEVSLDVQLDQLQRSAVRWQQDWRDGAPAGAKARVWVVDRQFNVLADSEQPLGGAGGLVNVADADAAATAAATAGGGDLRIPLASRLPARLASTDLDATLFTLDRVHHVGGWALAAAVRIGSPWVYVQALPDTALHAVVLPTLLPNALLGLALLAIFVAGQWFLERRFVAPALEVLAYLRRLSRHADAPTPQLGRRWSGWVAAVRDTFRQQRALQQRERAHEAFKSAMVDHAPTAIITASEHGQIIDFNPAAERIFGLRRADVIGRRLGDTLVPERHRARHRAEMKRLRNGERVAGVNSLFEMRGLRGDGSEIPIEVLSFAVQQDGENFYIGFINDLSAKREQALQLERQRDALRQNEKLSAMGTMLAGVAHELNNPLAIVMGRASLLEEKIADGELAADARRIREAAERCGRIVRTFLNMARKKPAERSDVQLNDIVRAAADMLGYTLRSHGIAVELQLADGLPEVQADGDQLGQVVLNLIVNAQQALLEQGAGGQRRIGLRTGSDEAGVRCSEACIWLRVADTGPGVQPQARERMFEPFFTTKDAGLGTGLGLSVSRSIAREHGGDLVLEPAAPGDRGTAGAVFTLTLPLQPGGAMSSASMPLVLPAGEAHARVLVVDDEPEIADLLRAMLEGAGFDVATAESGAVALELLAEARFDAIVSDVRMPDIDGAALWRAVRERWPLLARRLLFVTGDTLSPQARQLLDESGCASLDKPFRKADLLAAVHAVLER